MSRPKPGNLAVFVAALVAIGTLPIWLKGGLYLTNYEGDALHLADIVLRMADGQRIHHDFMTPLGVLSVWPIAAIHSAGVELGHAFVLAQTGVAALSGGAIWWAAATRLPRYTAYAFAASSVVILTSLAHGYDTPNLAVSMHYNRWAWGLTFSAVVIAVLPALGKPRPLAEGGFLAVLVWVLTFLKITYAVALLPALLLILAVRGEWRMIQSGLVTGVILAGISLMVPGYMFILAYIGDLSAAISAPLRDAPGLPWNALVVSPAFLVPSVVLAGSGIFLRRSGRRAEGLSLLLLLPVFVFITWQNFGNAPLWLIPVAAILAATYAGDPAKLRPIGAAAIVAAALAVPPVIVHGGSGVRLLAIDASEYTVLVPGRGGLSDMHVATVPAQLIRARRVLNDAGEAFAEVPADRPDPEMIAGEAIAECQLLTGIKATLEVLAEDLGDGMETTFIADIVTSHWLYGGGPLPQAAPWNYGTLHGIDFATHVLVPTCPVNVGARRAILEALDASGATLRVSRRTPRYLLLQIN